MAYQIGKVHLDRQYIVAYWNVAGFHTAFRWIYHHSHHCIDEPTSFPAGNPTLGEWIVRDKLGEFIVQLNHEVAFRNRTWRVIHRLVSLVSQHDYNFGVLQSGQHVEENLVLERV